MSYCEETKATSFTSNAGEATEAKVAEIISSFSADLYALYCETEAEKKASILAKYPGHIKEEMDTAVIMSGCSLENAEEEEDVEELTSSLNDIVSVNGNNITIYATTSHQDTSLFFLVLYSLLPLMDEAHTKMTYTYDDSREGISTDVVVLYKDGSVKSLDELLAAA